MIKIKTRVYQCAIAETITFNFTPSIASNVQVFFRFGVGNLMLVSGGSLSFSNQPLLELMFVFKTAAGDCQVDVSGSLGGHDTDVPSVPPDLVFPEQRRYHFLLV